MRNRANEIVRQNVVIIGIAGGAMKMIISAISTAIMYPTVPVLMN
jgi:hypothetical protein